VDCASVVISSDVVSLGGSVEITTSAVVSV